MPLLRNIFCFGLLVLWCLSASAQTHDASDDLQPLKMDITDQILERSRLQQENQKLRQEYETIKARYADYLRKIEAEARAQQAKARMQAQADARALKQKSVEDIESDVAVLRAQTAQMKITLLNLQEQERLWKMKFADVEYQRQMLELEASLRKHDVDQKTGLYLSKIDRLNREILRNRAEEKELAVRYAMLEDEAEILVQQQTIFENENKYLGREAVRYQDMKDKFKGESDTAQKAFGDQQQKIDQAIAEKKKQKADLEEQLKSVRDKQKILDDQLNQTLKNLQGRQQLTSDILRLKEDNDRLQSLITSLQSQAQKITP